MCFQVGGIDFDLKLMEYVSSCLVGVNLLQLEDKVWKSSTLGLPIINLLGQDIIYKQIPVRERFIFLHLFGCMEKFKLYTKESLYK